MEMRMSRSIISSCHFAASYPAQRRPALPLRHLAEAGVHGLDGRAQLAQGCVTDGKGQKQPAPAWMLGVDRGESFEESRLVGQGSPPLTDGTSSDATELRPDEDQVRFAQLTGQGPAEG